MSARTSCKTRRSAPSTSPLLGGSAGTVGINKASIRSDVGYIGVGSIGYGFGNGLRVEGQGEFQSNKFDRAKVGAAQVSAGGNELKYSGFVNVLYDLDLTAMAGPALPVVPYVGVGVGYSWVQDQNARFYGSSGPAPGAPGGVATRLRTNNGDGSFAYQAILGAALPIYAVPGLALTLEYRFMGLAEERSYAYQYTATPSTAFPAGLSTRAASRWMRITTTASSSACVTPSTLLLRRLRW